MDFNSAIGKTYKPNKIKDTKKVNSSHDNRSTYKHKICGAILSSDKVTEIANGKSVFCSAQSCKKKITIKDVVYNDKSELTQKDIDSIKLIQKSSGSFADMLGSK